MMKNKYCLYLMLVSLVWGLSGCSGPEGPMGPAGPSGAAGPPGPGTQTAHPFVITPDAADYTYSALCPEIVINRSTVNCYISMDSGNTYVAIPASYYDDAAGHTYTLYNFYIQTGGIILTCKNYAESGYSPIIPASFKLLVTVVNP